MNACAASLGNGWLVAVALSICPVECSSPASRSATKAIHSSDGINPPDLFSNGVPSAKSHIIGSACLLKVLITPLAVGVGSQRQSEELRSHRRLTANATQTLRAR